MVQQEKQHRMFSFWTCSLTSSIDWQKSPEETTVFAVTKLFFVFVLTNQLGFP